MSWLSRRTGETTQDRALWVSTSMATRGGIATYVRVMRETPLWTDWNIRHVATHRDGSAAAKLAAFGSGTVQFIVELIRLRPQVVHLHASADASFVRKGVLFWISRAMGVPVVLHMHGSDFQEYFEHSSKVTQTLIRATLSHAGAVVALGEVWAARLRAIAPSARITLIPNAVRPASPAAQPAPGQPVRVVFLGRLGVRKGAFRLLDAWDRVVRDPYFSAGTGRLATLTMAGDGEVEEARRRIGELGLEDSVEVREWLSEQAAGELLDNAQVLVLPSRNEGQPMAVLEAMARGLCVISSEAGGLAELVGGGCGVLVGPDDIDAIAAALLLVIGEHHVRVQCGAAALARVEALYDARTVSARIGALYREMLRSTPIGDTNTGEYSNICHD